MQLIESNEEECTFDKIGYMARQFMNSLDNDSRLNKMIITDGKNGFYYVDKQGIEYKFDNSK